MLRMHASRAISDISVALLVVFIAAAFVVPLPASAQTLEEQRAQLEAQLRALESEIKNLSVSKVEISKERVSLEREIALLNAEIEKAQVAIRHRDLTISQIKNDISGKQEQVRALNEKLRREQESLAQIIRRTREVDDFSLVELALSGQSISSFLEDVDTFEVLKRELGVSFDEIAALKSDLSARTLVLEDEREQEASLLQLQILEKKDIEVKERARQVVLGETRSEEERFQSLISEREKTAAQIRSALFELTGGGGDISFGDAYDFAKEAERLTGVRAAFLLGIIKNESDLGKNVGQCLLTNQPNKGDGVGRNTGTPFSGVMKPSRDVDPFMEITARLGIDPFSQVVSCPQSIGFGGAIGPAQFIPSTWVLYEARLSNLLSVSVPNPWDPRTAFLASALLLKDNGADRGSRDDERLAALRYFAGWAGASNPAFAPYGTRVLRFADEFQAQIDVLEGN